MSNIMDKKFLLAVVLLVCLVAIYAEAQRYGGGGMYGGGRGGYGGGRGYYGGGMYGGGRGGYGGGRGYYGGGGGYGGGRGGYRGYHHDQNSVYPSGYSSLGGGGGYYDDMSGDDDYSSYGIDVYAASSSNPNQLTTTNVQSDGSQAASSFTPTVAAGASSTPRANRQPLDWGQRQQQPDGISPVQDLLNFNGDSNRQWPGQSNDWNRQGQFGSGADYTFDLTTGGANDQSTSGSSDRASERHVLLNGSLARASAANSPTAHGNDSRQLSAAHSSRPSVPTSTTTPAPEFIMINPTTTSS